MIFGPWLEKSDSPNGRKSDRLIGIRVQVTWLEVKAWWRKLFKRREPGKSEIILPTGDDETGK